MMVDVFDTRNEISATVVGNVVQAGVIHQVVVSQNGPQVVPAPRQLPGPVSHLVGRASEIAELDSLLVSGEGSQIRVVDGMAGVGKTTLAVWWAYRVRDSFPDGTLFANLRGHDREQPLHPSSVLTSFLQALGMADARIPVDLDAQAAAYRSVLDGRRVLVVLDNAASAEQVRPLLPGSPGCAVLVTSRRSLIGLAVTDGATSLSLGLFDHAEAEDLFRAVLGDDRVAREPGAVARLIDLCARLPLALRVAAGRVVARRRCLIADLVEEIDDGRDRLDVLSGTGDDRSSVRVVFDWSYARLPEDEALLFRRLGLHPGGEFSLHAAAAFGGVDVPAARRQVEALVDANLVDPVELHRYRVHDLLHLYVAQRGKGDESRRHRLAALRSGLTWYAHTALVADALVFPAHPRLSVDLDEPSVEAPVVDRDEAWAWLKTEHHTLLAALRRALDHDMHDIAVALAGAMRFLVFRPRALWPVRLDAESLGLRAARLLGDVEAEATFLRRRADTLQMLGRWAESDADLALDIALAERSGERLQLGKALCGLGRSRKLQNRLDEAREHYLRALPLVRGSGYVEAVVEANLSQICAKLGRHGDALEHALRELELRGGGADPAGEGYALHDVAVAYQCLGNDRAAVEFGYRAITVYRIAAATKGYLAEALETVARSRERQGSDAAARSHLLEAAAILAELGDPRADLVREKARSDLAS